MAVLGENTTPNASRRITALPLATNPSSVGMLSPMSYTHRHSCVSLSNARSCALVSFITPPYAQRGVPAGQSEAALRPAPELRRWAS